MSTGRDTVQLRHGQNSAAMMSARTVVTAAALTATLGLAAACWVVAVRVAVLGARPSRPKMSPRRGGGV
jgi:hypothetical protein